MSSSGFVILTIGFWSTGAWMGIDRGALGFWPVVGVNDTRAVPSLSSCGSWNRTHIGWSGTGSPAIGGMPSISSLASLTPRLVLAVRTTVGPRRPSVSGSRTSAAVIGWKRRYLGYVYSMSNVRKTGFGSMTLTRSRAGSWFLSPSGVVNQIRKYPSFSIGSVNWMESGRPSTSWPSIVRV